MSSEEQQAWDWKEFTSAARRKGACEFSGLRATECVASICDCFETPEGAAAIEAAATEPLVPSWEEG